MDFRHSKTHFQAVNQYVVKERIGVGGMGTVYLAFDVQLKRHVALKVLNTLDQGSLERFVREREITADLDHPNFVRILSMGYLSSKDGLWPFYTMPLLRGETLAALIRRRIRSDEAGEKLRAEATLPRLLSLVQQICLALESAHQRGIIHRDLKPANIVMGPYGELYIVDLGLAKYLHEEEDPAPGKPPGSNGAHASKADGLTGPAEVGTLFYMAPEQIDKPSTVDVRSDIFGVGAILYTILTGQRPLYLPEDQAEGDFEIPPVAGQPPTPPKPRRAARERRQSGRRLEAFPIPHWHEDEEPSTLATRTKFRMQVLNDVLISPERIVDRRRRSTEAILDPVDPALSAICMKALARKPEDRYPTCRAMWQELEKYLEGRKELILMREAGDLTRTVSLATVPNTLRTYELAERRLHERILQRESVGRLGIEEKLDLFDLLLGKAKISERHGDSQTTIRAVTRAEPVIETALEVLQRQYIQLLMAKGTALTQQEDPTAGKETLAKAIGLARIHKHDDLVASAYCGYGIACAGTGDPADYLDGLAALEDSINFADRSNDLAQGVRSRVGLARLHMSARVNPGKAMILLDAALGKAGQDPSLLAEVHLVLGESYLGRKEVSLAIRHLEEAILHAKAVDARNLTWEAHLLLGQAHHALGHLQECGHHLRKALRIRGPRRAVMERKIAAFCEAHRLTPEQLGLDRVRETTQRLPGPSVAVVSDPSETR
ncbi:MAG TPA: serine/threonine-protein kinase [Planctomycetota bacterium]